MNSFFQRYTFLTAFLLLIMSAPVVVMAQNSTASPYSRFGYGELNDNVPGAYRGLGGVGVGMRQQTVINAAQPASYTVVDSTTFMFDLALSAMWDNYQDASGRRNRANGNLEYLTMQFPIYKHWIGMSLGVLPYSQVGYDFAMKDSVNANYHYTTSYEGSGAITEVYGGLSFNICNWVALGANVYYMFGTTTNSRSLTFTEQLTPTIMMRSLRVSDVRFRLGAQLFHTFAEDHKVVLGAIFENKSKLNGEFYQIEATTFDSVPTTEFDSEFPMVWGVGLSYCYRDRMLFAADYTRHDWANAKYSMGTALRSRGKLSLGFQYRHNPLGRRYIDHIPWQVGFSMEDSYLPTVPQRNYSATIGVGFPLRNLSTVIYTALEYGHRGSKATLSENYLKLTISASISENWFFKRKL